MTTDVDTSRWTLPFTTFLFPLDVTSDDDRMWTGTWTLTGGGPVAVYVDDEPGETRIVGEIRTLTMGDHTVMGDGVIDPDVDLSGLYPQADTFPAECRIDFADGPDIVPVVFLGGEVRSVKLGTTPTFPDVWIRARPDSKGGPS